MSCEDAFWDALGNMAFEKRMTRNKLICHIAAKHDPRNLSSAVRVAVLQYYIDKAIRAEASGSSTIESGAAASALG